jgi:hypothetical protein
VICGETPRELAVVYGLEARSINDFTAAKQTLERHLAAWEQGRSAWLKHSTRYAKWSWRKFARKEKSPKLRRSMIRRNAGNVH